MVLSTDLKELRDRLRSVRREVEDTATEVSNLEDYFKLDMGTAYGLHPSTHPSTHLPPPLELHLGLTVTRSESGEDAFHGIRDKTFELKTNEYTYKLTPFKEVKQQHTRLGYSSCWPLLFALDTALLTHARTHATTTPG